jgi:hypothetical protein
VNKKIQPQLNKCYWAAAAATAEAGATLLRNVVLLMNNLLWPLLLHVTGLVYALKKMGMPGAWGTGTAEQRNISASVFAKYG